MRLTKKQLKNVIRKMLVEHMHDDHDRKLRYGKRPAVSEPGPGYVEDHAEMYAEDEDWEGYLKFGQQYGYPEDQLEVWFGDAEEVLFQRDAATYEPELIKHGRDIDIDTFAADLRSGKIDLAKNPYALD